MTTPNSARTFLGLLTVPLALLHVSTEAIAQSEADKVTCAT